MIIAYSILHFLHNDKPVMTPPPELSDFIREAASSESLAKKLQVGLTAEQQAVLSAITCAETRAKEALRTVKDPEMSVNIVDLGLVYSIDVGDTHVHATMTLTAPTCPVAELIPREAEARLRAVFPAQTEISVTLVWRPAWTRDRMSDEAKLLLDMW